MASFIFLSHNPGPVASDIFLSKAPHLAGIVFHPFPLLRSLGSSSHVPPALVDPGAYWQKGSGVSAPVSALMSCSFVSGFCFPIAKDENHFLHICNCHIFGHDGVLLFPCPLSPKIGKLSGIWRKAYSKIGIFDNLRETSLDQLVQHYFNNFSFIIKSIEVLL